MSETTPTDILQTEEDVYLLPASFSQQRLWFIDRLLSEHALYNIPFAVRFSGCLHHQALEASIREIISRHEVLRTTFDVEAEQLLQVVSPSSHFQLPLVKLPQLQAAELETMVKELASNEANTPFDLQKGPLLRAQLLRLSAEDHVLLFTMHHIISDGWSCGVLMRELIALYRAIIAGQPSSLPDLPIQYGDYAVWQREYLEGDVQEKQMSYWKDQLSDLTALQLPTDFRRPPMQTYQGAAESFELSQQVVSQLRDLSQQQEVTLFMTMLAAFQVFLARYCGQEDFAVGTPIAGRTSEELEGLIGFFVNTLVMRADLSGNPTFDDVLARVCETASRAYAHQDLPFEQLVKELQPERDLSRSPLFQVLFALQNAPQGHIELPGVTISPVEFDYNMVKFDLSLQLNESDGRLCGTFSYNTDLFGRETIRLMIDSFQTLLASLASDSSQRLSDLTLLSDTQRQQLLIDWNDTSTAYPQETIHRLFAAQAEQTPDHIAVTFDDVKVSYRELNEHANQLAHFLKKQGVTPQARVGLCMERSIEMIISMLGILKAGAAYVPIDPAYPADRLAYLAQDSTVSALLTQAHLCERLPTNLQNLLLWETIVADVSGESREEPRSESDPEQLAYVMYTSGSTGLPKGVCIPHRAVIRLVKETDYLPFDARQVFLQFASISFDAATFEIWGALLNGARLVIYPSELPTLAELGRVIRQENISVLWLTAGLFHQMIDERLEDLSGLHFLLAGGDALSVTHVQKALSHLPNTKLINGYGPTESTTFACTHLVSSSDDPQRSVPIGRPITNTTAYVFDAFHQLVPRGVPGELYIGGDGLALGYLNRPDLTEERFVAHPFAKGKRLYKTGDLVRWLPNGTLEFLGRLDNQVKIRGFRVELGEIEAALTEHPSVRESAVIVCEDMPGDKRLAAYLTVLPSEPLPASAVRAFLKTRLPAYMIPSAFVILDTLPLNANGKVERRLLPKPEFIQNSGEYTAPRNETETLITKVWSNILHIDKISVHDNFFELGGHSLLAMQAVSRLSSALYLALPLKSLFEASTPAQLAEWIDQVSADRNDWPAPPLSKATRDGRLPMSFAQQRLWLVDQLLPGSPAYNIPYAVRLDGTLNRSALEASIGEIISRHEVLRTTFAEQDGELQQIIKQYHPQPLLNTDLRNWPDEAREAELQRLVQEHGGRPFDLGADSLIRLQLVQMADDQHVLLLNMHHIISDGWSMGVFTEELCKLYTAQIRGEKSPLSELPLQYADYAAWQRDWLQGEVLARQVSYWKEQLSALPVLELPTDRPRPAVQTYNGANETFALTRELSEALLMLSKRHNVTLFMTLLCAFQTLLARYSGQDDIPVGTPIAGRNRQETEGLIGFFVNTLVLRTDLSGNPTFAELLARVRERTLDAYAHQEVPFEKLVQELQPERDRSRSPLFQVMFLLQNTPQATVNLPDLSLSNFEFDRPVSKFDLSLGLSEAEDGIIGTLTYNTDLFEQATIQRMIMHFTNLLRAFSDNPELKVLQAPLLTAQERHQLLFEWNDTAKEEQTSFCIQHLFEAQVEKTPDATALVFADTAWTYDELNKRANRLAHLLQAKGVGPEVIVGILVERSPEMVLAALAVLKAGGAYLPLDPSYPQARLNYMVQDAQPHLLLAHRALNGSLPTYEGEVLWLDDEPHALNDRSEQNLEHSATPDSLAYVTYTSGSTGNPKGVLSTHRGAVNYLRYIADRYALTSEDTVLQLASFSFDASVRDLIGPLLTGAKVVIVPDEVAKHPPALLEQLETRQVTAILSIVPTLLHALTKAASEAGSRFPNVRLALVSGEVLYGYVVQQAQQVFGAEVLVVNQYGPTECTMTSTYHPIRGQASERTTMLAGRPIPGNRLYVLDAFLEPVPLGVAGEVYLGGAGVTRGYLKQPELTAEKFIASPFLHGERLYRTGDKARLLADGNLEFLGRLDNQIKLRGLRIELDEIQATLSTHPEVRESLVILGADAGGEQRLIAYVVPKVGGELSVHNLRIFLKEKLPEYMIPTAFVTLAKLPLTPNGKIDRRALPVPAQASTVEYVAPRSPIEETVCAIWSEVLNVERVGIHDNFFELGGHSLLATQIISRINAAFQLKISLQSLFQAHTVESLSAIIETSLFEEILNLDDGGI
ncbi:hypothetical protein CIG75_10310 [Tumebacillus algifaecis]|uniref:Carrier domain-containing protein n=1 Tax=Tumebacillus algifaecis TaxID=1214604 RepID=A0A223D1L2_9BACL|nr:non-ribosomal peptide synthetase [Tumebacillus algifaecis]ASS75345.1 hypothetical protein CIG75_10310 [Tumebacillus algifaecis]